MNPNIGNVIIKHISAFTNQSVKYVWSYLKIYKITSTFAPEQTPRIFLNGPLEIKSTYFRCLRILIISILYKRGLIIDLPRGTRSESSFIDL